MASPDDERRTERALAALLAQDANKRCADCGRPGTRWASWSIGVFLCTRCGGVHRSLGTHVSRVKSVTLDRWTEEQVARMAEVGNARANALYNPHPERYPFPLDARDAERYIRDKYERRLFAEGAFAAAAAPVLPGAQKPTLHAARVSSGVSSSQPQSGGANRMAATRTSARPQSSADRYPGSYAAANTFFSSAAYPASSTAARSGPAPVRTAAQSRFLAEQRSTAGQAAPYARDMQTLIDMGFTDVPANAAALRQAAGNVEAAVSILVAQRSPVLPADAVAGALTPSPRARPASTVEDHLFGVFASAPASPPQAQQAEDPYAILASLSPKPASVKSPGITSPSGLSDSAASDVFHNAIDGPAHSPPAESVRTDAQPGRASADGSRPRVHAKKSSVDAQRDLAAVFGGMSLAPDDKAGAVQTQDLDDFAEFEAAPYVPPPKQQPAPAPVHAPAAFDAFGDLGFGAPARESAGYPAAHEDDLWRFAAAPATFDAAAAPETFEADAAPGAPPEEASTPSPALDMWAAPSAYKPEHFAAPWSPDGWAAPAPRQGADDSDGKGPASPSVPATASSLGGMDDADFDVFGGNPWAARGN